MQDKQPTVCRLQFTGRDEAEGVRLCACIIDCAVLCCCCWLFAGIAAERRPAGAEIGEGGGAVVMFDVKELKEVRRVGMPSHVAAVQWHPKINQIFVGIGEAAASQADTALGALGAPHAAPARRRAHDMVVGKGCPSASSKVCQSACLCLARTSCAAHTTPSHTHAGDKRGGSTHVLYDTTYSRRGALLPVARAPRVANPFDLGLSLMIKTPHALPMYREDPGRKRGREKSRNVSTGDADSHSHSCNRQPGIYIWRQPAMTVCGHRSSCWPSVWLKNMRNTAC